LTAVCYESRHLPGWLKVAPYEVRGRVAKNEPSPGGTAESSLGSPVGKRSFTCDRRPALSRPCRDSTPVRPPYPGLGVLGYFHAVPSGPPGTKQSLRLPQKPILDKSDLRASACELSTSFICCLRVEECSTHNHISTSTDFRVREIYR
jgi:hypothetical protein